MAQKAKLNRWKGLTVGLVGGLAGVYAMRYYWQYIAPELFPDRADWAVNPPLDAEAAITLVGQQYEEGETSAEALGRRTYEILVGKAPKTKEVRGVLGDLTHLGVGLLAGGLYGGTRTRTYPRDVAGGFFYGIRLWLGDMVLPALMGLRAEPTAFSFRQHLWRLSGIWVYSFVTTAVTRILYWLF
jgi:hypothetical protein